MTRDPFTGDIQPLEKQPSAFRRRVGDWRIFFDVYRERRQVDVTDIRRRTTTTYRKRK
jgi:mRNA-degrading endonuclease RelE of RelBE toxin-antitoxin system